MTFRTCAARSSQQPEGRKVTSPFGRLFVSRVSLSSFSLLSVSSSSTILLLLLLLLLLPQTPTLPQLLLLLPRHQHIYGGLLLSRKGYISLSICLCLSICVSLSHCLSVCRLKEKKVCCFFSFLVLLSGRDRVLKTRVDPIASLFTLSI